MGLCNINRGRIDMKAVDILMMGRKTIATRGFITEWTLTVDTTAGRTVTLPLYNSGTFNCTVDWGDGSALSTITTYNDDDRIHEYASTGTYEVEIIGECPAWSFDYAGDRQKISDIIYWGDADKFGGFQYLVSGFWGCNNLKSLGEGKILAKAGLTNLFATFNEAGLNKTGFTIPSGLLDNCVNVTNFAATFAFQTKLVSLPTDLFKYCTKVTTFHGLFRGNTLMEELPTDIFRYNTSVNTFVLAFRDCPALDNLPTDLFRYNTLVTNFYEGFSRCFALSSLPQDIFRYNTLVTTFEACFKGCTSLASTGSDLFKYNTSCTDWASCFSNCNKLQQNSTMFFAIGEEGTRFLNQSPSFPSTFIRGLFTGTQGTAPALWDCNYGTGTPAKGDCWGGAGNNLTSLTNYADIPGAWI